MLLPRMQARIRASIRKFVFELALVFIAVLAALVANAWWEGCRATAAGRTALAAVAAEMQGNRAAIEDRLAHHRAIVGNA